MDYPTAPKCPLKRVKWATLDTIQLWFRLQWPVVGRGCSQVQLNALLELNPVLNTASLILLFSVIYNIYNIWSFLHSVYASAVLIQIYVGCHQKKFLPYWSRYNFFCRWHFLIWKIVVLLSKFHSNLFSVEIVVITWNVVSYSIFKHQKSSIHTVIYNSH